MRAYELHEPIGTEVPREIYLSLMMERRGIDLEPISEIVKNYVFGGVTVMPYHIEDGIDRKVKKIASELRNSMSKFRKEEIHASYVEMFLRNAVINKV